MGAGAVALAAAAMMAEGALNHVGGAIMEQQLHDLGINKKLSAVIDDIIEDAVLFLASFIKQELERNRLAEVSSNLVNRGQTPISLEVCQPCRMRTAHPVSSFTVCLPEELLLPLQLPPQLLNDLSSSLSLLFPEQ